MASPSHLSYVSVWVDDQGTEYGTATCEDCGPVSDRLVLEGNESRLREIADLHWVQA
jgi:hypothetical protein